MFTARATTWGVRGGRLIVNGTDIATPNFVVATTRGAVDHLTPDHSPLVPVGGVYAEELYDYEGLVDSISTERSRLPVKTEVYLGACRAPGSRSITNKPNTIDGIGIDTVQGSRLVPITTMVEFMAELKPDLFLVPYDVPAQSSDHKVGTNRLHKMEQRSLAWFERFVKKRLGMGSNSSELMLVARIPPELRARASYMEQINLQCDAYCFTDSEVAPSNGPVQNFDQTNFPTADPTKLRLSDRHHTSWRGVLEDLKAGSDIVHIPLTQFSNAGQALALDWNVQAPASPVEDLHDSKYTTDMRKLGSTGHAYAYLHHLLKAEEMTAQVLLQQHNLTVASTLFASIRESIDRGTFDEDCERFLKHYGL